MNFDRFSEFRFEMASKLWVGAIVSHPKLEGQYTVLDMRYCPHSEDYNHNFLVRFRNQAGDVVLRHLYIGFATACMDCDYRDFVLIGEDAKVLEAYDLLGGHYKQHQITAIKYGKRYEGYLTRPPLNSGGAYVVNIRDKNGAEWLELVAMDEMQYFY